MNRRVQRVCRIATWLAWAAFACRALTPLGYMPATIGDGGPFALCPSGSQAELVQYLQSRSGHAHHADNNHGASHGASHGAGHGSGDASHDQHQDGSGCPIGASFAVAVPVTLLDLYIPAPTVTPSALPVDAPVATAPALRYLSRAPPFRRSV